MSERIGPVTVRTKAKGIEVISPSDLAERALRSCTVGSAACAGCFGGVEVAPSATDASAEVTMIVAGGANCGASEEQLRVSMGRLETQQNPAT